MYDISRLRVKQSVVTFRMRAEADRQKAVVACVTIMGCHIPTFQYYAPSYSYNPVLWAVTF